MLTQGSVCFARNPGLGKRNSFRVAAACVSPSPNPPKSPSPTLPKGRETIPAVFEAVGWCALPLGRVGEGLQFELPPLGEGWGGALGGLGWGPSSLSGLTLNTIIPASTWTDGNDLWVNYEKCIDAAMLNSISGECSFHRNVRCAMYQLRCYLHLYKSCNT